MENEKTDQIKERIFVVAGLGDIGSAFAKRLSKQSSVFGISRTPRELDLTKYISADLLNKENVRKVFEEIPPISQLIYLHLVGKFSFQDSKHPITDENKDGIRGDIKYTNS